MNTKLKDEEAAITNIQDQMRSFLKEDELIKRLQADGAELPIMETEPNKHTSERRIWDWIHWSWGRRETVDKILKTASSVFHKQLRVVANF